MNGWMNILTKIKEDERGKGDAVVAIKQIEALAFHVLPLSVPQPLKSHFPHVAPFHSPDTTIPPGTPGSNSMHALWYLHVQEPLIFIPIFLPS